MRCPHATRLARRAAMDLHDRFCIRDVADIDVLAIAALLGVEVREGGIDGAAARLIGNDRWAIVRVSNQEKQHGARNFSIAHELGHRQLAHPSSSVAKLCSLPGARVQRDRSLEHAADAFAAEFLMPSRLLANRCSGIPATLSAVTDVALDFKTTVVSAAFQFVDLTRERCAFVYSREGRVVWASCSATLTPEIQRGTHLGSESIASKWFSGQQVYGGSQRVAADAWFKNAAGSGAELWEDSLLLRDTRAVVSMLWIPDESVARIIAGPETGRSAHLAA